jgi:hypothetical protein
MHIYMILLDLDMHCRQKDGRWRYSDDNETVRKLMRQLHNKMMSSTHTDRERTYNGNNNSKSSSSSSRSQRSNNTSSSSHGKSSTNTSAQNRILTCNLWNGRDKNGVWTSTSHCSKSDDACRYSHLCSQCNGSHPRFTKDACKHTEHDSKHDSK